MEEIIEEQFNLEHKIEFINYENLEYRFILTPIVLRKRLRELIEDEQNRYGKILVLSKACLKRRLLS